MNLFSSKRFYNFYNATSLGRDSLIMVAASVLVGGATYLYQLVTGILLSVDDYSILMSLSSLLLVINILGDTITLTVAKFISHYTSIAQYKAANYLGSFTLKSTLVFGLVIFLVMLALNGIINKYLNISNPIYSTIIFASVIISFCLSGVWGILQGQERFYLLGINRTVWAILRPVSAILLILAGTNLTGAISAIPISYFGAFIFVIPVVIKLFRSENEKINLHQTHQFAFLTLIALLSITFLINSDVVFARHYLSPTDAGVFSEISVLGRITLYAPMGIAIALFPKTSAAYARNEDYKVPFLKGLALTIAMCVIICIIFALFGGDIVQLIFPDESHRITPYILNYSVGMGFLSVSYVAMLYLLSINKNKIAYVVLSANIFNIIILMLFHTGVEQIVQVLLWIRVLTFVIVVLYVVKNLLVADQGSQK